MLIIVVFVAF